MSKNTSLAHGAQISNNIVKNITFSFSYNPGILINPPNRCCTELLNFIPGRRPVWELK